MTHEEFCHKYVFDVETQEYKDKITGEFYKPEDETLVEEPVDPHAQVIEVDFVYFNTTRWLKTDMSMNEYQTVLNSGMLDERPLAKMKVVTAQNDEMGESSLVYDFAKAKSGEAAWVLL